MADGIAAGADEEAGVDVALFRMLLDMTPAKRLDAASSSARAIEERRALRLSPR